MKRAVACCLVLAAALVIALTTSSPATAIPVSGTFFDDDGSFHEPDINAIAAAGITTGCGPALYCPNSPVTRGEMATFLTRALKLTPADTGPFSDLAGNLHASNINAIAAAGITTGCAVGAFCPNQSVTREEMASFLVRALKLPPATSNPFTDVTSGIHAADIAAIAAAGITSGCAPSRYCPASPVTRAQMATFLTRALPLDKIFPRIPMFEGVSLSCTKDGLVCQGSITVPFRSTYEVREGFYDVAASGALASGSTRVEFSVNGSAIPLTTLPGTTNYRPSRLFRGTFSLVPGSHILVASWFWNGYIEQTTTIYVTVTS